MMTLLEAFLLGIIQGATEFLPISSSGHLILVPSLLNMQTPDLAMVAWVHQGTLLAVLIYFFKDIVAVVRAVWEGLRRREPLATPEARLGWLIVVGSIPVAVAGIALASLFDQIFTTPAAAAFFLLVTAGLLVLGERRLTGDKQVAELSWLDAIVVGLFQMLALLPGISRSGSTISGGLGRGLDRQTAARYSFLLGIPAILGAGLTELSNLALNDNLGVLWPSMLVGFAVAAVTGLLCIHFLLRWLGRGSLYPFAAYCAFVGAYYLLTLLPQ